MAPTRDGGTALKAKHYETPTAFRRALEDRLAATAKLEGLDLQRIRRQVAFDRLLCRLFAEPNPPWVLKGVTHVSLLNPEPTNSSSASQVPKGRQVIARGFNPGFPGPISVEPRRGGGRV